MLNVDFKYQCSFDFIQNWHITNAQKRQQHNDGSKTIAEIFKAYVHYEMAEIYNVWNTNWEVSFRKMRSC